MLRSLLGIAKRTLVKYFSSSLYAYVVSGCYYPKGLNTEHSSTGKTGAVPWCGS